MSNSESLWCHYAGVDIFGKGGWGAGSGKTCNFQEIQDHDHLIFKANLSTNELGVQLHDNYFPLNPLNLEEIGTKNLQIRLCVGFLYETTTKFRLIEMF